MAALDGMVAAGLEDDHCIESSGKRASACSHYHRRDSRNGLKIQGF